MPPHRLKEFIKFTFYKMRKNNVGINFSYTEVCGNINTSCFYYVF